MAKSKEMEIDRCKSRKEVSETMVEIDIKQYCQNCSDFEPRLEKKETKVQACVGGELLEQRYIKCKKEKQCERLKEEKEKEINRGMAESASKISILQAQIKATNKRLIIAIATVALATIMNSLTLVLKNVM